MNYRISELTANLRSMKWYFCLCSIISLLHATIRIAILKLSCSISVFSRKIFIIFLRLKVIEYGRVLRIHSLLQKKEKQETNYLMHKQFCSELFRKKKDLL